MTEFMKPYIAMVLLCAALNLKSLPQYSQRLLNQTLLEEPMTVLTSNTSNVQFVFVVGLEGTGHHLHRKIVEYSPSYYQLRHTLKNYKDEIKELHSSLYNKPNGTGLWNLPCDSRWKDDKKELLRRQQYVASLLKGIQEHIGPRNKFLRFPVNTLWIDREDIFVYGMCSYPNWQGPCRFQQYPRLEWFYDACDMAGVDCRHLYLYRDPLEILYSTTVHRPFNANLSEGIALYESMLDDAILPDLTKYSHKSLGCVGFYGDEDWKPTIQSIWQWTNTTKYYATINKIYKKPSRREFDEKLLAGLSINAWQQSHDYLMEQCHQQPSKIMTA